MEETHNLTPRWNAESQVTLEEMYNHKKTPYSLETNCISLSSNANVARTYGETFSDKYIAPKGVDTSKSGMKKGIIYKAPFSRISSFQALDDEQTLEKNKIVAKLTILEQKGLMKPAVSRIKTNSELIKTIGRNI